MGGGYLTSLNYIARLLNVHGAEFTGAGTSRGSERPDLISVYGALGLGNLPDQAAALGLAIYSPCREHEVNASRHIMDRITEVGDRDGWNCEPVDLKARLATLALLEIRQDGKCLSCNGTGRRAYRNCRPCNGSGAASMRESVKYRHCGLSRKAWNTWQPRYNRIYSDVLTWKSTFDQHIIRHFE